MKNNIIKAIAGLFVTQLMTISIAMACDVNFALEALNSADNQYNRIMDNDLKLSSQQVEWDLITNSYYIIDIARTCNDARIKRKAAEILAWPYSLQYSLMSFQISFYLADNKKLCEKDIGCSLEIIKSASIALNRSPVEKLVFVNQSVASTIVKIYEQTPHSSVKKSAIEALQKCATKRYDEPSESSKFCDKAIMEITTLPQSNP